MHLTPERAMAKASEDSRATWSVANEEALITFLQTCQAEDQRLVMEPTSRLQSAAHLATSDAAVRFGPVLRGLFPNAEPDQRFGSAFSLNLGPDPHRTGPVVWFWS